MSNWRHTLVWEYSIAIPGQRLRERCESDFGDVQPLISSSNQDFRRSTSALKAKSARPTPAVRALLFHVENDDCLALGFCMKNLDSGHGDSPLGEKFLKPQSKKTNSEFPSERNCPKVHRTENPWNSGRCGFAGRGATISFCAGPGDMGALRH